ncbi:hypothetical protein HNV12_07790 [Methanococcoides sp. SA1]|nr:hypothetical protein [Methanococcoides sp. SA1]
MSNKNKVQELEIWCNNLIKEFRKEYAKLDELEKSQIPNNLDYSSPCQIEFFWVDEPLEYQLFMTLHDPDRKDSEIVINGPYKGYELIDKVVEIMGEPQWNKKTPYKVDEIFSKFDSDVGDQENKYSDAFIPHISSFISLLRTDPTANIKIGLSSGQIMGDRDWCANIKGNISEIKKPIDVVSESIEIAKQQAFQIRDRIDSETPVKKVEYEEMKYSEIIGAYYYPTIRIGDQLELTFKEKLINSIGSPVYFPTIDSEFTLNGKFGFFDTFGFIGIQTKSKKVAIDLLNSIFGISLIFGYEPLSVRESELIFMKFNSKTKSLGGFTWQNSDSKRPTPYTAHSQRKIAIPLNSMRSILDSTDIVLQDQNLNESLLFLLESYTHLQDYEYSSSFLFSWFIVETYISQLFEEMISEKQVSNSRREIYDNHGKWSSETKIEVLNFCGKISSDEHSLVSKYNKIRNNFVHKGKRIDKNEAKDLFKLSKLIMRGQILQILKDNNFETLANSLENDSRLLNKE